MKWFETLGTKELEEERGKAKGLCLGRMKPKGSGTKTKRLEEEDGMLEKWRKVCCESKTFRIMHIKKTSSSILSPQIYTML